MHAVHTRSPNGPHAWDSKVSEPHVPEHAAHTVSCVGPHGAEMNCVGSHTLHAAQVCPVPVKPGVHVHVAMPPWSTHAALTLQPPLFVAHTPIAVSGTHVPSAQVVPVGHALPQTPQSSRALARSTQLVSHGV